MTTGSRTLGSGPVISTLLLPAQPAHEVGERIQGVPNSALVAPPESRAQTRDQVHDGLERGRLAHPPGFGWANLLLPAAWLAGRSRFDAFLLRPARSCRTGSHEVWGSIPHGSTS
jgi:hypothetical protein